MRTTILKGEPISQCKTCFAVKIKLDKKRTGYQQSICDLPGLEGEDCWNCLDKTVKAHE